MPQQSIAFAPPFCAMLGGRRISRQLVLTSSLPCRPPFLSCRSCRRSTRGGPQPRSRLPPAAAAAPSTRRARPAPPVRTLWQPAAVLALCPNCLLPCLACFTCCCCCCHPPILSLTPILRLFQSAGGRKASNFYPASLPKGGQSRMRPFGQSPPSTSVGEWWHSWLAVCMWGLWLHSWAEGRGQREACPSITSGLHPSLSLPACLGVPGLALNPLCPALPRPSQAGCWAPPPPMTAGCWAAPPGRAVPPPAWAAPCWAGAQWGRHQECFALGCLSVLHASRWEFCCCRCAPSEPRPRSTASVFFNPPHSVSIPHSRPPPAPPPSPCCRSSAPIPKFQHPSHSLLEENGFTQMKYDKFYARCIQVRLAVSYGCRVHGGMGGVTSRGSLCAPQAQRSCCCFCATLAGEHPSAPPHLTHPASIASHACRSVRSAARGRARR